jgi:hypothetical protein
MIKIEAEPSRNLLSVIYCGDVVPEEIEEITPDFKAALGLMEPGFRLLTDLGGLESMSASCAPFIEKFMDMINAKAVAMVVRIVPDPKKDIGFQVMSYFHYRPEVGIVTVETAAEAMAALAD